MTFNHAEKGQAGAFRDDLAPTPIASTLPSTGPSTGTTTPSIHSGKGVDEKQIERVSERAILPEQLGSEISRQVRRKPPSAVGSNGTRNVS